MHALCRTMLSPREGRVNAAARVLALRVHAFLPEGTCNKQKSTFVCRVMASGNCSEEVTEMGEEWHTGVGRPCLKKKNKISLSTPDYEYIMLLSRSFIDFFHCI